FGHLLNDTQDLLLFVPLRTIYRRFEVIEKFIQFIECELRTLCHSAICFQSLGQMSGQLGVFEDSAALSFREFQLQEFSRQGERRWGGRSSTPHPILLVLRRWLFFLGHVLVPFFGRATPLLCIGLDVCRLSQDGVPGDSR